MRGCISEEKGKDLLMTEKSSVFIKVPIFLQAVCRFCLTKKLFKDCILEICSNKYEFLCCNCVSVLPFGKQKQLTYIYFDQCRFIFYLLKK